MRCCPRSRPASWLTVRVLLCCIRFLLLLVPARLLGIIACGVHRMLRGEGRLLVLLLSSLAVSSSSVMHIHGGKNLLHSLFACPFPDHLIAPTSLAFLPGPQRSLACFTFSQ